MKKMKKVFFVTGNKGKAGEVKQILEAAGVSVEVAEKELNEPRDLDHEKIVSSKARQAFTLVKKPVVVEDTALFFDAFPLFPGTYSKHAARTIGLKGCLKLLEGKARGARFVTLTAFKDGKQSKVFKGVCRGRITKRVVPPVPMGLAYDAVFVPEDGLKAFSRMTKAEKARYSHRAKAFKKLAKWLKSRRTRNA